MTKAEFIRGLREALADAPDALILENVNYYSSYIDSEIYKGRTETEILEELGEPQWIAKSILDANQGNRYAQEESRSYQDAYYDSSSRTYSGGGEHQTTGKGFRIVDLNKWYIKALLIAIPVLLMILIFTIMGAAFRLVIRIVFSPVFWGIVVGIVLLGWFTRKK